MMPFTYGERLCLTITGESHAEALGATLAGLPAGERIDREALCRHMARRAPGGALASARREPDEVEFLSGLAGDVTNGEPVVLRIQNRDARPADYASLAKIPRPGHADYPSFVKFGEIRPGGGAFSGRMTAPLCAAGGIALQLLARRGIRIAAHILSVAGERDEPFDPLYPAIERLAEKGFPVLCDAAGERMQNVIRAAAAEGDSVGGVIECAALGLPPGIGNALFQGLESRISAAVFAIPAVKGVEFGAGFAAAELRGSENNDPFFWENGCVRTRQNRAGGLLGGVTTGMPLLIRAAFKPTPSIARPQESVNLYTHAPETISVTGRHDPCVVPRAVPCVESAAALAILDAFLEEPSWK